MNSRRLSFSILTSIIVLTGMIACQANNITPTITKAPALLEITKAPTHIPLPSATIVPAATATFSPNTLYFSDYGLRIQRPEYWDSSSPDDASSIVLLNTQDQQVFVVFLASPASESKSLNEMTKQQNDLILNGLENIQTVQDQGSFLGNGQQAWTIISTGNFPQSDMRLKTNVTSSIQGSLLITAFAYSSTFGYDLHAGEIDTLLANTQLEAPTFFDIPRDQALMLSGGETTNPREYDPATTHGSGDKRIFSGLVSFDPNLNLIPELAEYWDVSQDGTVYTFHLRPNARFHDGRTVTTQDVIYSWERAADPKTKSDTVLTYLGDIVGLSEMNAGKSDHISGLKALDEQTLQVTIDAPKPYFLLKLTYPTGFVLDKANVESDQEWYRQPNGTGPYKLQKWDRFKVKIYERNPNYYLDAPQIPYIIEQLYSGESIRLFEMGQIDISGVPSYDVPRVTNPAEPLNKNLLSGVTLCTNFVVFDTSKPPFDDPKVRQAFTLAFDRQRYVDVVMQGNAIPAQGLYPPGLPGYNTELKGFPFDPERARQLLAESKYGGPEGLPPILYTDAGIGNSANSSTAALAEMWQHNLGVEISIENLEPNFYIEQVHSGNHGQIMDGGWCADYPDPENFADVLFHSGAAQNDSNYSNPALDKILEQARIEQDVEKRMALYQQAEQIIVDDAPVLFTINYVDRQLVKSYVKGYTLTPIDIPIERYLWLDWSQ
jgi:oligopeptide transport system substrate-binding protein